MSVSEAQDYHAEQIEVFAATDADLVSAFTLNYVNEAIGVARAARAAKMPVVISFTVETDGRLPTGQTLKDAIVETDRQDRATRRPTTCSTARTRRISPPCWRRTSRGSKRLRGLRANASTRSHAELDAAPDLDAGDPVALGQQYRDLRPRMPQLTSSAAAAAPITGTWSRSALPARRRSGRWRDFRSYLPLKGGGRHAQHGGWGSSLMHQLDPLPNPPPFRGRETSERRAPHPIPSSR